MENILTKPLQATLFATFTGISSLSYAAPMRAVEDVTNIFTSTRSDRPTKAASYYKKISNDMYELNICPNGASYCPGKEINNQSFWYPIRNGNNYSTKFKKVGNKPSFDEPEINSRNQCVAFVKAITKSTDTTKFWNKGHSVQYLAGRAGSNANVEHRGKIIAFFQGNDIYPQNYPYGHVGMLAEYVYNSNGDPIGFWIVDQNFKGKGIIRKHLLLFNNGYGHTNASNYHFVR